MSYEIFHNIDELISRADALVGDVDVVSFDLFDTLVVRRIYHPGMITPPVARFIAGKAEEAGVSISWQKVNRLREEIEKRHRKRNGETGPDEEARYPEYISELLEQVFGDKLPKDMLKQVMDYELTLEKAVIVPRAAFMEWIKKIYEQGKKILILSDIYLPSDQLKELVTSAGFAPYVEDVYSSADELKAKASCSAFPVVEKRHKLDKKRWLHIGDNPISDGLRPSEFGLTALVLRDVSEKQRKAVACRYQVFSQDRPFWKGRNLQQIMAPLEAENGDRHPLYVEGYNFIGPIIGCFVQRVAERVRELEIPRLFFMSREGWTFMKVWEKSVPLMFPTGPLPEISYLYGSRIALAPAACAHQGLTVQNVAIAFLPPGNRDFRDVCRVFGLDVEGLKPFLQRYNLKEDDALSLLYKETSLATRTRMFDMLEDGGFQEEVKRQTRPANNALQMYLEQEGFFKHKQVALVDVGWLGTIQRFLHQAIKHRPDCPRLNGFVLGASRGIEYPTTPDNYIEGLYFDRNRFDFAASVILYNRDLFEEACRAPHPGLRAYRLKNGKPELEFRHTDDESGKAELAQTEHFAPLQEAILDAAERYGVAATILGFRAMEARAWLNGVLVSKIAFPRTREVEEIREKHHLDDFYGKHTPPAKIRRSQVHLWDRSFGVLRFNPFLRLKYYLFHALLALRQ